MRILPNYRNQSQSDHKTRLGTAACISSFVTWNTVLCAMALSGLPLGGGQGRWGRFSSYIIQPIKNYITKTLPQAGSLYWAFPAALGLTLLPVHSAMVGSFSTECPITLISGWAGSCATLATVSIILEKNTSNMRGAQLLFLAGKVGTATSVGTFTICAAAQHQLKKNSKKQKDNQI